VKERLTGAIILVAVLVLLVPELLSGPGEGFSAEPAAADSSIPLRSYTIDLADDTSRRVTSPRVATGPSVGPVTSGREGGALEEGGTGSAPEGRGPANSPLEGQDRPLGSGADRAAATPPGSASAAPKVGGEAGSAAAPSPDDDRPRSAFGPNAVQRPKPAASAPSGAQGSAAAARASSSTEPARSATPAAASGGAARSEPARPAASDAKVTKGWAVQLGVFASRENAERLARQVKGKGYTVSVNETSASGKRLYRVRVGPEASRPAAEALHAKLRAAGHTGQVVAWP
jgi:DedD protein